MLSCLHHVWDICPRAVSTPRSPSACPTCGDAGPCMLLGRHPVVTAHDSASPTVVTSIPWVPSQGVQNRCGSSGCYSVLRCSLSPGTREICPWSIHTHSSMHWGVVSYGHIDKFPHHGTLILLQVWWRHLGLGQSGWVSLGVLGDQLLWLLQPQELHVPRPWPWLSLPVPVLPATLWPCLPVRWTHPDSPVQSNLHSSSGQWGGLIWKVRTWTPLREKMSMFCPPQMLFQVICKFSVGFFCLFLDDLRKLFIYFNGI